VVRPILFAGLFIVSLVSIATPSFARTRVHTRAVAAEPIQDRYCLEGNSWGYYCEFSTYEQCKATASGNDGACTENRSYLFAEQRRGYWPPR
jgi:hypothetical protein